MPPTPPAHAPIRVRPNPFSPAILRVQDTAQEKLAAALDELGQGWRAHAVLTCARPRAVGFSKTTGEMCEGNGRRLHDVWIPGVPTAQRPSCGHRLCARRCAGDARRKVVNNVMERLDELSGRETFVGPMRESKKKEPKGRAVIEGIEKTAQLAAAIAAPVDARADNDIDRMVYASNEAVALSDRGALIRHVLVKRDELRPIHPRMKQPPFAPRDEKKRPLSKWEKLAVFGGQILRALPYTGPRRREQRRARRGLPDVVFTLDKRASCASFCVRLRAKRVGRSDGVRRTRQSFRAGPPPPAPRRRRQPGRADLLPLWDVYGCRFITLTQPARAGEPLEGALDRLEAARARLLDSPVWKAHVDASLIRVEFEWTDDRVRREKMKEADRAGDDGEVERLRAQLGAGEWWHVHMHIIVWGIFWPADEKTARRSGVDVEDALLNVWRRALVESGQYNHELEERCAACRGESERCGWCAHRLAHGLYTRERVECVRYYAHRARRRQWARALEGVKFGGAHIKLPRFRSGDVKRGAREALSEAVKYVTKPIKLARFDVDEIVEILKAIDGRRLIRCTGLLYGVKVDEDDTTPVVEADGIEVARLEEQERVEAGIEKKNAEFRYAFTRSGAIVPADDIEWRIDDDAFEQWRRAHEERWEIESRAEEAAREARNENERRVNTS